MATCREIFTFSWPLRGRGGGGQPKRSAWPLFPSFCFDAFPMGRGKKALFVGPAFHFDNFNQLSSLISSNLASKSSKLKHHRPTNWLHFLARILARRTKTGREKAILLPSQPPYVSPFSLQTPPKFNPNKCVPLWH